MAPELDYSKLNRHQKIAVFLVVIGVDAASSLLNQFDDADVDILCREISHLSIIPQPVQAQVFEEFSGVVVRSAASALGGLEFAQRTLGLAKGDRRASAILDRLGASKGNSTEVVKEISDMEGRQIFNLIRAEQPQTMAFVLSYLDTAKASEVLGLIDPAVSDEVIERLGTIESTSVDLAGKIARSLGQHFDSKSTPTFYRSGGVRAVADLINLMDKETSKTLLVRLEERNATLSAAIRKKLFGFEDLNRLQPSDLQRVLREVESGSLAIAMKSATETLRAKFYAAISKRAAESLKEEIEMLGTVRLKDVEVAQDAIIQVVRRLEEENQITLDADGAAGTIS